MDEATPPAKPRLAFGRGRTPAADAPARTVRERVPVHDALARMASKIGDRRRASGTEPDDEDDGEAVRARGPQPPSAICRDLAG